MNINYLKVFLSTEGKNYFLQKAQNYLKTLHVRPSSADDEKFNSKLHYRKMCIVPSETKAEK